MDRVKRALWLIFLLGLFTGQAEGVVIEGVTPSGKFKTVFVTEAGRFPVDLSTGTVTHVIVDSGFITVTQATGTIFNVKTVGGVPITVTAATATVTVNDQFDTFNVPIAVLPADTDRKQGIVCNNADLSADPSILMYLGDSGVNDTNGVPLFPGSCYSPDVPASFTGDLFGFSTSPAHGSYIYHK